MKSPDDYASTQQMTAGGSNRCRHSYQYLSRVTGDDGWPRLKERCKYCRRTRWRYA